MRRHRGGRERHIYELSQTNRWYRYEREKKHLSSQKWETEAKSIAKHLRV